MSEETENLAFRLAFREEGSLWACYIARSDNMDDATPISTISMNLVKELPSAKRAFMEMNQIVLDSLVMVVFGTPISHWGDPKSAPEHERSKNGNE